MTAIDLRAVIKTQEIDVNDGGLMPPLTAAQELSTTRLLHVSARLRVSTGRCHVPKHLHPFLRIMLKALQVAFPTSNPFTSERCKARSNDEETGRLSPYQDLQMDFLQSGVNRNADEGRQLAIQGIVPAVTKGSLRNLFSGFKM